MYYVYMLRCENGSIYTGIAKDAYKRFEEHKSGNGAKYTKVFKPLYIAKIFELNSRSQAQKLEFRIKKLSKQKKENLIKGKLFLEDIIENNIKNKY